MRRARMQRDCQSSPRDEPVILKQSRWAEAQGHLRLVATRQLLLARLGPLRLDFITKAFQLCLQFFERGSPEEKRCPENRKLRLRIDAMLDAQTDGQESSVPTKLPNGVAREFVFTIEAREP